MHADPTADWTFFAESPFLLIVEGGERGPLYFGPYRSESQVEAAIKRIERLTPDADWSVEHLQPGSFLLEWCRMIAEDTKEAADA